MHSEYEKIQFRIIKRIEILFKLLSIILSTHAKKETDIYIYIQIIATIYVDIQPWPEIVFF